MSGTLLLSVSILLNAATAALAVRGVFQTRRIWAWTFLTIATLLMLGRRVVALDALLRGEPLTPSKLTAEWLALGVSFFLLLGVAFLIPLIRSISAARDALAESETRLRAIIEHSADAIFLKTRTGRYSLVNPAAQRVFGRPQAEIVGRTDAELLSPQAAECFRNSDAPTLAGEIRHAEESVLIEGQERVFLTTKSPVRGEAGAVVGLVGVAHEITDRIRAERELKELELALENAMPAIARLSLEGKLLHANSFLARMVQRMPASLIGMPIAEIVHADDRESFVAALANLRAGAKLETELRLLREDGSALIAQALLVRPLDAPTCYCFAKDISERRQLEQQHLQAQKLEAVARLAGGVAHDSNNILTAVLGSLDLARRQLQGIVPETDPVFASLREIDEQADRAAALTRSLLALSRTHVFEPKTLRVAELIAGILPLLRRAAGDGVQLDASTGPGDLLVDIDPVQLEQVLLNLVQNARDAMPDGGTLTLRFEACSLSGYASARSGGPRSGRFVRLSVSDTGTGMSPDVMQNLFQPFFSTKPPGRGAGLGLATAQHILSQCGGFIEPRSTPGQGSIFEIYLPQSSPQPSVEAAAPATNAEPGTVLVCEDDRGVREFACRVLADAGFQVEAARDAREALSVARRFSNGPQMLVSDVALPDMNGWQLARLLRAERPTLRVLFVSGYSASVLADSGELTSAAELLEKPFKREKLLSRVRAAFAHPPPVM